MMFVFDSSALISMSQTCLVKILRQLREALGAEFVIAESVYRETVSTPLHIRRFELNAVRLKKAVDEKWLRIEQVDTDAAMDIVKTANNCFFAKGGPVSLMHRGEADALALVRQLNAQVLVIDERTTRMLLETPLRLKELLEGKHNAKIGARKDNLERLQGMFRGLAIVRSVELVALAFEKGIFAEELQQDKQALEAALYAAKYSGCSVSGAEIDRFLQKA